MKTTLNAIFSIFLLFLMLVFNHIGFAQTKNIHSSEINPVKRPGSLVQKQIMPSVATWSMAPNYIDLTAAHSPFKVVFDLRNMGSAQDVMDDRVHDQIKKNAEHARKKGISLVADLDARLSLHTFEARYPNDLQQMLVVKEIELKGDDATDVLFVSRKVQDHYQKPYPVRSGSFVKAFAYNLSPDGLINPNSLREISGDCMLKTVTKDSIRLAVPAYSGNPSSRAFVMVLFTYLYPDVYSPHLMGFEREIVQKYADTDLAGGFKDEWGFPNAFSEESMHNEYWYTANRAKVYAERTGGRNLLNDILLMNKGIKGREAERIRAINYFQEMARIRNVELEKKFYTAVKEGFGPHAIVGVHSTWFPYPERREYRKNGLDWWEAKRDWAQTDEVTPFGVRTSLTKKIGSPVWYNMYYRTRESKNTSREANDFEQELWSAALAGGRINNLPHVVRIEGILESGFIRAETRVRLLNYIDPSPLNCPVAVIFGLPSAMNWAGPGFEEVGMNIVDSLWRIGIPADLIPSSEIENNSLTVDDAGYIRYGKQRYSAAILYHPQFEKPITASFFNRAAKGKTRIFRIGDWTKDFNGNDIDGDGLLPEVLRQESSIESILTEIPHLLMAKNIPRQTPATRLMADFGHTSYAPPATGYSYLLDGTLLQVAGTRNGAGDTIRSEMKIGKYNVRIDAVGVAAVRLDKKGNLQALAASELKSLEAGKFKLNLEKRIDLALWKNKQGAWEGLVQGWDGDIPSSLLTITKNWIRLDLPGAYRPTQNSVSKTQ